MLLSSCSAFLVSLAVASLAFAAPLHLRQRETLNGAHVKSSIAKRGMLTEVADALESGGVETAANNAHLFTIDGLPGSDTAAATVKVANGQFSVLKQSSSSAYNRITYAVHESDPTGASMGKYSWKIYVNGAKGASEGEVKKALSDSLRDLDSSGGFSKDVSVQKSASAPNTPNLPGYQIPSEDPNPLSLSSPAVLSDGWSSV